MTEKYTLIDGKPLAYQGLFDLQALFKTIDKFFKERSWMKNELKNFEQVEEDGKQIILELFPWKKISDYAKMQIRVFMVASKLKDVQIEIDGVKRTYQQGSLNFVFDAYLFTDYESYWDGKAIWYFFHILTDKFIRKGQTQHSMGMCKKACNELQDEIKSFLNMNRYRTSKLNVPTEPKRRSA